MLFGNKTKQVESAIDHKKADKLIALAKDKDEAVALAAVKGLGVVGGEDAINFLVTQLRHIKPEFQDARRGCAVAGRNRRSPCEGAYQRRAQV